MSAAAPSPWVGWIGFAGTILVLNGFFSAVQGFLALIGEDAYFRVADGGGVYLFDATSWGWWNLLWGLVMIATGVAVFSGVLWARILAVAFTVVSAIGQLLVLPAQPWWSLIVIAVDILVIVAITAHGRELVEQKR